MRRTLLGVALGIVLGAASSAQAGPLLQAVFSFQLGDMYPAIYTASGGLGGSASGTGAGATWAVSAGDVPGGLLTLSIPTSAAPPIERMQYVMNGNAAAGSFSASADGQMVVTGEARVKAYGGLTLLGVPVTVGAPSVIQPPVVSGIGITAWSHAWTSKTTSLFDTYMNVVRTRMGSNGLVNGGGTVVLVSALNVVTSIAGQLPSFATLTLTYAPDAVAEPALALLAAAGAAGALRLWRRRAGPG